MKTTFCSHYTKGKPRLWSDCLAITRLLSKGIRPPISKAKHAFTLELLNCHSVVNKSLSVADFLVSVDIDIDIMAKLKPVPSRSTTGTSLTNPFHWLMNQWRDRVSLIHSLIHCQKKIFSNVVVTSNSSCVFLYLFSSVNISPVRFVLHLQD